jgi:hypothetical protein
MGDVSIPNQREPSPPREVDWREIGESMSSMANATASRDTLGPIPSSGWDADLL